MSQPVTTMTLGELFIPGNTLDYGTYKIQLTVRMNVSTQLVSSAITYILIVPSPIVVNLIQFGTSMITNGQQATLTLNPGSFSIDPDAAAFNANVNILIENRVYFL